KEEMIPETESLYVRNLTPLFEENSDCVGWINIPDTTVDYPVMHTPEEPEKYLRLNFYKEFSYSGVPFIDARCRLDSDNVFIYGHNMKNGTMFSDIMNYTIYEYCQDNPIIVLETTDGYREYTVCAVLYTDTTDSWFSFIDAENEDDFNNRIAFMKKESLHDLGVTPEYGQSLITLSTCDNTDDSMRLLVIAVDIN
ncbi:MAG: class B sortase, partial [Clostridia bacterium]|nr:class B sortase [Clostridia bacterium]